MFLCLPLHVVAMGDCGCLPHSYSQWCEFTPGAESHTSRIRADNDLTVKKAKGHQSTYSDPQAQASLHASHLHLMPCSWRTQCVCQRADGFIKWVDGFGMTGFPSCTKMWRLNAMSHQEPKCQQATTHKLKSLWDNGRILVQGLFKTLGFVLDFTNATMWS